MQKKVSFFRRKIFHFKQNCFIFFVNLRRKCRMALPKRSLQNGASKTVAELEDLLRNSPQNNPLGGTVPLPTPQKTLLRARCSGCNPDANKKKRIPNIANVYKNGFVNKRKDVYVNKVAGKYINKLIIQFSIESRAKFLQISKARIFAKFI